jgi:hypothetical protein
LSGFSVSSIYRYEEVEKWCSSRPSEFMLTEIRADKNGIKIMKGIMIGSRGRRSYIEFKDNSSPFNYEVYYIKN